MTTSGPRSSRDRVFHALAEQGYRPTRDRDDFMARCPVHEDRSPSLHVTWRSGGAQHGGGLVLLRCFGCEAEPGEVAAALGLTAQDLFDEPLAPRRDAGGEVAARLRRLGPAAMGSQGASPASAGAGRSPRQRRRGTARGKVGRLPARIAGAAAAAGAGSGFVAARGAVVDAEQHPGMACRWEDVEIYHYVDLDAEVRLEVTRRHCTAAGVHKTFSQSYPVAGGKLRRRKPDGWVPVLYRWPEVAGAVAAGEPVWLLEGEKDVHAAERHGVVATTNPGGGGVFPEELLAPLAGADVRVVLDRDGTGWRRGVVLHEALTAVQARVQLLLPDLQVAKSDLSDHLQAGKDLDGLVAVDVAEVRLWDLLSRVRKAADQVEECRAEATARADRAEEALQERARLQQAPQEAAERVPAAVAGVESTSTTSTAGEPTPTATGPADATNSAEAADSAEGGGPSQQLQLRAAELEEAIDENSRFASRWAVAAQVRWDGLADELAALRALADAAERAGALTAWGEQALQQARDLQRQAIQAARVCHRVSSTPLPGALQDLTADTPLDPTPQAPAAAGGDVPGQRRTSGGGARGGAGGRGGGVGVDGSDEGAPDDDGAPGRRSGTAPRHPDQPYAEVVDSGVWLIHPTKPARLLLNLDARVLYMERADDTTDDDTSRPALRGRAPLPNVARTLRPITHVVIAYTDPSTGEQQQVRVSYDDATECAWLDNLVLPGLQFGRSRTARQELWGHLYSASLQVQDRTVFTSTGWRHVPELGHGYVHARGIITAKGNQPAAVDLAGSASQFNLPDPTDDEQRLRSAWQEHLQPMLGGAFPTRVGAPVVGQVLRGVLGHSHWVSVLVGSPGSYKSGYAALAMHLLGEEWDRLRPMTSMSGDGATVNAMRVSMTSARHAVWWGDDVNPTHGFTSAQKLLEQATRMISDSVERQRLTREGRVNTGGRPMTSGLLTSEIAPKAGGGEQRSLTVPMRAADSDLDTIKQLDRMESRHGRALLMASYLQWLAADWPLALQRRGDVAAAYSRRLRDHGLIDRRAEALAELWAGWSIFAEFLRDSGAATEHETRQLLDSIHGGLLEAHGAASDPDMPTSLGGRLRDLLRHALSTGHAHVTDMDTDDAPHFPLAARLGWRRTPVPGPSGNPDYPDRTSWRIEPRGVRMGWIDLDSRSGHVELVLNKYAVEEALKAAGASLNDPTVADLPTAMRALGEAGLVETSTTAAGHFTWTCSRTIRCHTESGHPVRQRMVVIRLDRLLDEGDQPPTLTGLLPPPPDDHPGHHPADPDAPRTSPDGGTAGAGEQRQQDAQPRPDDEEEERMAARRTCDECRQEVVWVRQDDRPTAWLMIDAQPALTPAPGMVVPTTLPDGRIAGRFLTDTDLPSASTEPAYSLHWETCPGPTTTTGHQSAPQPGRDQPELPGTTSAGNAAPDDAAADLDTATAAPTASPRRSSTGQPLKRPMATPTAGEGVTGETGSGFAVAVCDVDDVVLPDGSRQPHPQPIRHLGDVAAIAERLQLRSQATRTHTEPGTVVLTTAAARQLGLPVDDISTSLLVRLEAFETTTRGHAAVLGAVEDGWDLTGKGEEESRQAGVKSWLRLQRGATVARVAVQSLLEEPLDGDVAPEQVARRLQRYADTMGYPWRISGWSTGVAMLTGLRWRDRDRLWRSSAPLPPSQLPCEANLDWCRPPRPEESELRYLHAYDRGGSYAAGMAGLEIGTGDPVHHPDGVDFTRSLPGYWRITRPAPGDAGDWRYPTPVWTSPGAELEDGTVWVTSPTLELAQDCDVPVEIHEAYTWPEHSRVFDSWNRVLSKARLDLDTDDVDDQAARLMVKQTYTRTLGIMLSVERRKRPGWNWYTPERQHAIVAKARSNLLRRVRQIGADTGVWPVAMQLDNIVYASDDPDPFTAWPGQAKNFGRGFGQLRPEASTTMAEGLPHLTGGSWRGKSDMTRTAQWMQNLDQQQAGGDS